MGTTKRKKRRLMLDCDICGEPMELSRRGTWRGSGRVSGRGAAATAASGCVA